MVFLQIGFKSSSLHELHHYRQLILNGDALKDLHDFGVFCLPRNKERSRLL